MIPRGLISSDATKPSFEGHTIHLRSGDTVLAELSNDISPGPSNSVTSVGFSWDSSTLPEGVFPGDPLAIEIAPNQASGEKPGYLDIDHVRVMVVGRQEGASSGFTLWEKQGSFSHRERWREMSQTIQDKVVARVYGKGRGWVFTPNRFLGLGPRKSIDMALSRLRDAGTIRHLARGLYDYPVKHPKLGLLSPKPDVIAQAIAEKDDSRLQPSGAYAVNLLGLSQQVPAKIVYLTDGAEKSVEVGNQRIELRRTTPKNMATAGTVSGLVIQAFRYLRKDGVTDQHIATLRRALSDADRERLWKHRVHAPAWMHPHFDTIRKEMD